MPHSLKPSSLLLCKESEPACHRRNEEKSERGGGFIKKGKELFRIEAGVDPLLCPQEAKNPVEEEGS
jgi:hypothetical protein